MNLRSDLKSPMENLIELFKKRVQNCQQKIKYEKDITFQNEQLEKQLIEIFLPISLKYQTYFTITINDENTVFSTKIIYDNGKNKSNIIINSIELDNIHDILSNKKTLYKTIRIVEKHLKYLNILIKHSTFHKIKTFKIGISEIQIIFNTRNRYF